MSQRPFGTTHLDSRGNTQKLQSDNGALGKMGKTTTQVDDRDPGCRRVKGTKEVLVLLYDCMHQTFKWGGGVT